MEPCLAAIQLAWERPQHLSSQSLPFCGAPSCPCLAVELTGEGGPRLGEKGLESLPQGLGLPQVRWSQPLPHGDSTLGQIENKMLVFLCLVSCLS